MIEQGIFFCHTVEPALIPGGKRELKPPAGTTGRPIMVPNQDGFAIYKHTTGEYIGKEGSPAKHRSDVTPWIEKEETEAEAKWLHNNLRPGQP